ncbi:hypothetical protein GT354_35965, partial [Streptomyces sp. SID3343]|nr:hypothetical protein [Streptomyces sp. SID3343]
ATTPTTPPPTDPKPPSQSPSRTPGTPPAPGRIDLRTISFAEDRGRAPVFSVSTSGPEDEALLAALYGSSPDRRPQEPSPATDFTRNVVVTLSVEGGCLDPTGARLYVDGQVLKPDVDFPNRTRPPECLAPYQRLARFEVPRNRLPEHPVLAGQPPKSPTQNG